MDSNLTITLVQTKLHWEDKPANLRMFEEKIRAIKEHTEIVVLPEMFSTGFSMQPEKLGEKMDGHTIQWMKEISIAKKIILTGSLIIEEDGKFFNRLVWVLPTGQIGCYDKRHLFAYAGEDKYYTPGRKRVIASVKGWRINLLICYDLRFPVWARQQLQDNKCEFDLMIYTANWPDRRRHAWKTLLQARAIENQCYVVGVNRVGHDGNNNYHTGDSLVADPLGEVLYQKENDEDVFTITLKKDHLESIREKLPFWKDGDDFTIIE
jgi:omega-amidase